MPRKKDYEVSGDRAATKTATANSSQATPPIPGLEDAYIDMVALLGPSSRFASTTRVLDLRHWLNRGIDPWVCAAGFCLKALLLSGSRSTASVTSYHGCLTSLFDFLVGSEQAPNALRPDLPSTLSPIHIQHFIAWLQIRGQNAGWYSSSARAFYKGVKAVLLEMFAQGLIPGESSRFFHRNAFPRLGEESHHTSLSDSEQDRLAKAIKADLVDIYHGRLSLSQGATQGLRLLLVAHRQGLNPTPLLEMRRDAVSPGFLPGTIRVCTAKYRNRRVQSSIGRAAQNEFTDQQPKVQLDDQELVFDLSEGAVLQQAIASTRGLVEEALPALKNRIWLHRSEGSSGSVRKGDIVCLSRSSLDAAIDGVIRRHGLVGDDRSRLRVNLSRLRKSRFDRALRASDGDIAVTANLMGNTPRVAAAYYPSMNEARKTEAADFMNVDYLALMRSGPARSARAVNPPVHVSLHTASKTGPQVELATPTPVSGCRDSLHGEHAPNDGQLHCDRYVMCLFCSSFVIIGTVENLWRLFSFQAFARVELDYLDETLGVERTGDGLLEELRDRYRLAIAYIDEFTQRDFARTRVVRARAKTASSLHPFWQYQMSTGRRARGRAEALEPRAAARKQGFTQGESVGT